MNLWSETLALAAAKRWYSSKTDVRHHFCNLRRHPTRQPVRCWQSEQQTIYNLEGIYRTQNNEIKDQRNQFCTYLPSFAVNQNRVIPHVCIAPRSKSILANLLATNFASQLGKEGGGWGGVEGGRSDNVFEVPKTTFSASRIVSSGMFTKGSWTIFNFDINIATNIKYVLNHVLKFWSTSTNAFNHKTQHQSI